MVKLQCSRHRAWVVLSKDWDSVCFFIGKWISVNLPCRGLSEDLDAVGLSQEPDFTIIYAARNERVGKRQKFLPQKNPSTWEGK